MIREFKNMKKKRIQLMATLALLSNLACLSLAESYSELSTVKGYTLGENFMPIKLQTMKSVEGCANQEWYYLSTATEGGRLKASSVITSYVTKEKLFLQITGCADIETREYPDISHVYQCNTLWCE